jgi:hypothetical protein
MSEWAEVEYLQGQIKAGELIIQDLVVDLPIGFPLKVAYNNTEGQRVSANLLGTDPIPAGTISFIHLTAKGTPDSLASWKASIEYENDQGTVVLMDAKDNWIDNGQSESVVSQSVSNVQIQPGYQLYCRVLRVEQYEIVDELIMDIPIA